MRTVDEASTLRQGVVVKLNDVLSTTSWRIITVVSWRIDPKLLLKFLKKSTVRQRGGGSKLNDALLSEGFFDLVYFPTNASLFCLVSNNKINKTSRGRVKIE